MIHRAPMTRKEMTEEDIVEVVDLIDTHDDDDAEDAKDNFEENGVQFQWVILDNNKIDGTSGFRPIPETDNTAYISWTYVHKKYCKKAFGEKIFKFKFLFLIRGKFIFWENFF